MKYINTLAFIVFFFACSYIEMKAVSSDLYPVSNIERENLDVFQETVVDEEKYTEEIYPSSEERSPRFVISGNIGYGWRTAKMPEGLNYAVKYLLDDLMSGPAYEGSFTVLFEKNAGLSFNYSALTGSAEYYLYKGKSLINYMGIDYVKNTSINEDWRFDFRIGMGYAGYEISMSEEEKEEKEWGSTVGLHFAVGLDYMLTKQIGVGASLSYIWGMVNSSHYRDALGRERRIDSDHFNDGVGLGQWRLTAGIRYYIP